MSATMNNCVFSPCRRYRYTLWREWENYINDYPPDNYVMFIGLNPSTADETKDDPTIRKCRGFAQRWGYSRMCMTNLFAWRATLPEDMKRAEDPVGEDNQHHLLQCGASAKMIIAAWGKHGHYRNTDQTVMDWLTNIGAQLHCLKTNMDGTPQHPLYIPYDTVPIAFTNSKTL